MPRHSTAIPGSRIWIASALAATLAIGVAMRFHLRAPELLRDATGGAAYVVAASLAVLLIHPRLTASAAAILGLAITCIVEFSQLISLPWLDAIRATRFGRLALGTTFSWHDFGPYIVGALLAWLVIRLLPRHTST